MRFVIPELADPMKHPKAVRRAVAQQQQAVRQAFHDHNERIRPLLPPPLQRLQETDLNDGLIRSLRIDPGKRTLQLCLLCGDLQQGYFDLTLDYQEIALTPQETSLLCLIAHEESAEIYWDEIDLEEGGGSPVFIHRLLWNTYISTWPDRVAGECYVNSTLTPEIELRFSGLEIEIIPRPNRQFSRVDNPITIVRDTDKIEAID